MEVKEVWGKAADEIERRGRSIGRFLPAFTEVEQRKSCPVCVAGAIAYVLTGNPEDQYHPDVEQAVRDLGAALGADGYGDLAAVYDFSDKAESDSVVIDKLRELAAA